MSRKGHLGSVKVDHKERQLQLRVRIGRKGAVDSEAVKDLKQLSGGERRWGIIDNSSRDHERCNDHAATPPPPARRLHPPTHWNLCMCSYTTVAFSLALGGLSEMPFRGGC